MKKRTQSPKRVVICRKPVEIRSFSSAIEQIRKEDPIVLSNHRFSFKELIALSIKTSPVVTRFAGKWAEKTLSRKFSSSDNSRGSVIVITQVSNTSQKTSENKIGLSSVCERVCVKK